MLNGAGGTVAVAVAVKRSEGRGGQRAVRWAVENLMPKADRLLLVHVMPAITSITTPSGGRIPFQELDASVIESYIKDIKEKYEEIFLPFKFRYGKQKIETLLLEGDNAAFTLLRYLSDSRTKDMVLGSCSSNYFTRSLKDSELPSVVLRNAPDTCNIYVVHADKFLSNFKNPILTTGICMERANLIGDGGTSEMHGTEGCLSASSTYSAEIEKVGLELRNTMTMYNQACEDLVCAQNKIHLLSSECIEEAQKVNVAQRREEHHWEMAVKHKNNHMQAEMEVEIAKKLLAEEINERQLAESEADRESRDKQKMVDALLLNDPRYRRYTKDDILMATEFFSESKMIGEGAYGKVYKCSLDHILVAIKVLRPEAYDRKEEFLREVEILSQLCHPHLVLLLGACPENGCLIYEYMECGNLEDHIFRRRGRSPLPWHIRFKIAFQVACGLAFLHSLNPEPIVHRDLKPGNILLDKYYVSKIGDVGLAKTISHEVPDNVTEYRDTVVAGTLNYLDPEYVRTGTLRPKSDLYSFGVIVLQLLAACHPNGIIRKFENALNSSSLPDILDKSVMEWPLDEVYELAEIALKCCELRCRDRPDLETEVFPILKRLAEFADSCISAERFLVHPPKHYYCPILQEVMTDPYVAADGFTYELEAIQTWVNLHDISPVTKQKLQHKMLTPNRVLFSAIQEWRRRQPCWNSEFASNITSLLC